MVDAAPINASNGEDASERFVVVFPTSVVRAKPLDIVSPAIHLSLKPLEGCRAGLSAFVRKDGDLRMTRVVIDVDNEVLGTACRAYSEWSAQIRMNQLEWCSGALDWNADYLPFELCLDAYLADAAVVDVTFDN